MRANKPIFVIGSPRSGTSILTWCLGQHSNILVQEESDWMGSFALQVEIAYNVGTARGERSQLSALGIQRDDFFKAFGHSINELILDHRTRLEAKIRARVASRQPQPMAAGGSAASAFQIARATSDLKARWVDGTPEYSFYVNPLRKLFPDARFLHIVRDVSAVVRSMLNFQRTGGPALVANEQQAYEYWLRAVRACLQAERAYGSMIVRRIRHADLIERPHQTVESLLAFLSEDFEPACLEPLQKRINSSAVPSDFDPSDPNTDPIVIDEATKLNAELKANSSPLPPDQAVAAELENSLSERIKHLANLEPVNLKLSERIADLQKEVLKRERKR